MPKRISILVVALGVGLLAILPYTLAADDGASALGSALMFSLASLLSGSLIGFLFGIPRALTSAGGIATGEKPAAAIGGYAANTNLEQISDWLTKLLLGATLVQLDEVRDGGARLFSSMAPAFGGRPEGASFAGSLVVYFTIVGFLLGWLATRLFLAPALNDLDAEAVAKLTEAGQAEAAGEADKARSLRQEAADLLITAATPLSKRYVDVRRSQQPSPDRTNALEELVAAARQMARMLPRSPDLVRGLFRDGDEGERIAALGFMEERLELVDLEAVTDAIVRSKSAFEQFHGLKVALALAQTEGLPEDERTLLLQAVRGALNGPRKRLLDDERRDLGRRVISELEDDGEGHEGAS